MDPYLERKLQTTLLEDAGEDVVQLHSEANVLALFQEVNATPCFIFDTITYSVIFATNQPAYIVSSEPSLRRGKGAIDVPKLR